VTEHVEVIKVDEVYCYIKTSRSVERELNHFFAFRPHNFQFHPRFKIKMWDGYIRLFSGLKKTLYIGLLPYLKKFCEEHEYSLSIEESLENKQSYTDQELNGFINQLKLPYETRDYQFEAFKHAVNEQRSLLISSTGSGKSLILYLIIRFLKKKTLLIVPSISLVEQMAGDFDQYAENDPTFSSDTHASKIYSDTEKDFTKPLVISTWQSLQKMKKDFYQQFECIIVDEAHHAKAKVLSGILEKCTQSSYRIGTTGTLDGIECSKLTLEGLLGTTLDVTSTDELMKQGYLSKLSIKCLMFKYNDPTRKLVSRMNYQEELDYILSHARRNQFIAKLALKMTSNTLVMFNFVDKHGKILFELIKKFNTDPDRKIFWVSGETDPATREEIRKITETETNAILIASAGVFSTGINIKNLENIIFTSPSKSRIRVLQSIGRVLRIGKSDKATLYDLVDDLSWKSKKNYALQHFLSRINTYNEEKFNYKLYDFIIEAKI